MDSAPGHHFYKLALLFTVFKLIRTVSHPAQCILLTNLRISLF